MSKGHTAGCLSVCLAASSRPSLTFGRQMLPVGQSTGAAFLSVCLTSLARFERHSARLLHATCVLGASELASLFAASHLADNNGLVMVIMIIMRTRSLPLDVSFCRCVKKQKSLLLGPTCIVRYPCYMLELCSTRQGPQQRPPSALYSLGPNVRLDQTAALDRRATGNGSLRAGPTVEKNEKKKKMTNDEALLLSPLSSLLACHLPAPLDTNITRRR